MSLITRTVSINPAFLQEIKDDHHELRQLMHHTSAMLKRSPLMRIESDRLVEMFCKVRDQLAMHFSLEEAYGYFEDALLEAPRLSRRAEQLRCEHGELYSDFCQLVERAEAIFYHEAPAKAISRLSDDYIEFSLRFQVHEARESELILEALNDDIGAGD